MNHEVMELIGKSSLGRRTFIERTAKTMLGVGVGVPFLQGMSLGQNTADGGGKAKSLIYIYLSGGMTHLDTFDPKRDGSDVMGSTTRIDTNVDNMKFGDKLEKLSKHGDKLAVINSMFSTNGAHDQGRYIMRTGYEKRATIVHPTMGPLAEEYLGRRGEILPDSVIIGQSSSNAGYLDPSRSPLPIADPGGGVPDTMLTTEESRFDRRMEMAQKLGKQFVEKYKYAGPESYVEYYDQANTLLKSNALDAFDISGESNREEYGTGRLGQGCLLARRLVENGVRVVEVVSGGWDMHQGIDQALETRVTELDQAFSTLLADLSERGMLDSTLVAIGTEFGRTPGINMNGGRDHYPAAFSTVLAGGGIKGGTVYGETDGQGKKPDPKVTPEDFIATIGHGLGVPQDQEIYAPNGRPFSWAHEGKPVTKLYG